MTQHPSEISAALTTEHLQVIAEEIRRVRLDALETHQPLKGDSAWSFGCTCYARTVYALTTLCVTEGDWLRVKVEGLACTVVIGAVPIKFYKGNAATPSDRSLRRGLETVLAGQLSLEKDEYAAETDWFWLLAIETHENGTVSNIVIFQANRDGQTRHLWYVPQVGSAVAVAGIVPDESRPREGVDLPPVQVGPRAVPGKATEGDGNDDGGSN